LCFSLCRNPAQIDCFFTFLWRPKKSNKRKAALQPSLPRPAGFHGGIKNSLSFYRSRILILCSGSRSFQIPAPPPLKQFAPFFHGTSALLGWVAMGKSRVFTPEIYAENCCQNHLCFKKNNLPRLHVKV
jgi:hypothetical protein